LRPRSLRCEAAPATYRTPAIALRTATVFAEITRRSLKHDPAMAHDEIRAEIVISARKISHFRTDKVAPTIYTGGTRTTCKNLTRTGKSPMRTWAFAAREF
jgi:hypothetical protein